MSRVAFVVRTTSGGCAALMRAELGDGDLALGEDLEEERLELGIGAVDLVDRAAPPASSLSRACEERPRDEEALTEERALGAARAGRRRRRSTRRPRVSLGDRVAEELRVEHLLRVVPLVEGLGLVEALVALEADQRPPERLGERAREVGLADAGRALEQQRTAELEARARPRAPSARRRCRCARAPSRARRRDRRASPGAVGVAMHRRYL